MKKLRVTVNGVTYEVEVEVISDDEASDAYGYASTNIYSQPPAATPPPAAPVAAPPPSPASSPSPSGAGGSAKVLTSPLPGVVKAVNVKPGDPVKENTPVIVLEAMKMETIVSSPIDGKIKEVLVSPSQNVMQGDTLVTFE
ncbi:MAG: biotin/lipoyl-binding protein [Anaerolineae bacterium]